MSVIEQVRSLPLRRKGVDRSRVTNLQIDDDVFSKLRCAAAMNRVAMARLAELAIDRLLSDITAEISRAA